MVKNSTAEVCVDCGARVSPGAEVCDLCGRPLHDASLPGRNEMLEPDEVGPEILPTTGLFCNACGWKNPPGARFCSHCGARLQEVDDFTEQVPSREVRPGTLPPPVDAAPRKQEDGQAVTRQVAILTAAGVLLVVALYLVTVFSKSVEPASASETPAPAATEQAAATAAPLPPDLARQAGTLEQEIEGASGADRIDKQRQLVGLYVTNGRLDLAAPVQEQIAQVVNTPEAWSDAGNYYYTIMQQAEGQAKMDAGEHAVAAYRKVLEKDPDNLGIRTDLATALLGTNNPMEGVRQIKQVLAADPNHVQANFNYGVMLSMIGRVDQAITQFEKVKSLTTPDSDTYKKADDAIKLLRKGSGA